LFSNQDLNIGEKALDIGEITLDNSDNGSPLPLALHNQMIWDPCHQHYHFEYFNNYQLSPGGAGVAVKQGFCIQNVVRAMNTELSPVTNEFASCTHQGISPGWTDIYNIGIPCQWFDITGISSGTPTLTSHVNFKNILCEGTPVLTSGGAIIWDPTSPVLNSSLGDPVDQVRCNVIAGAFDNNVATAPLSIPGAGLGAITSECIRPGHQFGPTKDCEFILMANERPCTPGENTTIQCNLPANGNTPKPPHIVRVCETSHVLHAGTACVWTEKLASAIVEDVATISFFCPSARDSGDSGTSEPGGWFSIYTSPLVPGDNSVNVQCTLLEE